MYETSACDLHVSDILGIELQGIEKKILKQQM